LPLIVPATAVNAADAAPDATLTEGGTVSELVLLERVTVIPPEPAACDNVTKQLETHPELRLVGLQDSRLRVAADAVDESEIDAVCKEPL